MRSSKSKIVSTKTSGSSDLGVRIAIDTNRYVDFARNVPDALERLRQADQVFIPFVVLAKLRAGFLGGSKGEANERTLTEFLNSPRVAVLLADEGTTHHYARLFRQLRSQVTPIPSNDLWTAALVVQHDLYLFARDRHFEALPQLARV
jgi:predicted nucleic acid-binding protein